MFYSLREVGAAELVTAIGTAARAEARAAAQRLAAIGELVARQARGDATYGRWSCDNWDAVAAQVAAALNLSHSAASGQMYLAVALRNRLPKIGSLLAQGVIDVRLAAAITWHTTLITDPTALALVDAALAADAHCYGPLSVPKTAAAIDAIVERHDPAAVRRHRVGARGRDVVINAADQNSGTADFWGSLLAHDAALLDKRLNTMARDICPEDPRTMPQRRADALGTLAAGGGQLSCSCGSAHCPTSGPDRRAASIVVHVLAHPDSLGSCEDPETDGADGADRPTKLDRDPTLDDWTTGAHLEPALPGPRLPAAQIIDGNGLAIPAPALAGHRWRPRTDTAPSRRRGAHRWRGDL